MGAPAALPSARLRERLRAGAILGTFLKLPALETVDIAVSAGFDFAVVDGEHAQLDEGQVRGLVRHGAALGLPMVVRIPAVDAGVINRLLEAGAAGIQLSSLRAKAQRDALVSASRYAPGGTRSVSLAHPAADYGAEGIPAYLERQKDGPLLVGQIETATTADPLPELLRGLDVGFIGTTDLSVDLGRPGQLDDPRVRARVDEIAKAAASAGVAFGAWVGSAEALGALRTHAPRYVVVGSDLQLLRSGATGLIAATRKALA